MEKGTEMSLHLHFHCESCTLKTDCDVYVKDVDSCGGLTKATFFLPCENKIGDKLTIESSQTIVSTIPEDAIIATLSK
jgi:hypothetical protein